MDLDRIGLLFAFKKNKFAIRCEDGAFTMHVDGEVDIR
jgi:hypothetical protein